MKPLIIAALAVAAFAASTFEAAEPRDGRRVYESTCMACHGSGRDGAPRVGDARAWERLAARGLSSLGESALEGVRKMPPHGGRLELSDLEVKRAIVYMVNQSGGQWTEPIDRKRLPAARTADAIVREQCSRCHGGGVAGAPRIGDREAWIGRARLGLDGLVNSAIHGHGAMPARGGMADLTDAEVRSAVHYMVQVSLKR
jgi:cytochrome c5